MKRMGRWLGAAAVVGLALGASTPLAAETCSLQLKRLSGERSMFDASSFVFRVTDAQHFFLRFTTSAAKPKSDQPAEPAVIDQQSLRFKQLVKKEPAKYQAQQPLRGVAKLGADEYLFVLDAKDEKSRGFNRLLFDGNHNGDLTDDKPLEGSGRNSFGDFMQCTFPRVDLQLETAGVKYDYSFVMQVFCNFSKQFSYASAALNAAAYREGEISLAGKKWKVALVDFNSNGRFDDALRIRTDVHTPDGQLFSVPSDRLVLDPESSREYAYDLIDAGNQRAVSKLVEIDGRFYRMQVAPSGAQLTLTPADVTTGELVCPGDEFRALVCSDEACLTVRASRSKPARLPVGTWRLLSYRIEQVQPAPAQPPAKPAEPQAKSRSLFDALAAAFFGSSRKPVSPGPTRAIVTAHASEKTPPLEIRQATSAKLTVGPPYRPVVRTFTSGKDAVQLQLSIVGAAGETCTNMRLGNGRPPAPEFTIFDPKGAVVQRGQFSYG
jgi:hypothetical protein